MKLTHFLCLSAATVVLSSAVAIAAPVRAPRGGGLASYDGTWSVVIVTQRGTCDSAYRYSLNIQGGRVSYAGDAAFTLYGQVVPGGGVRVTVARGGQRADGVGRLAPGGFGSGTWRGSGSAESCSGTWSAERR